MLHTNHGELALIFDTFCRVWGAGGQATLTTRTEGGKLRANLELQLGSPATSRPQPLHPQQQRSKFASGHPEAAQHRHHRGQAAQAKSRARAAAHQAALAASSAAPVSGATSLVAASAASSVTPASSAVTLTETSAASAVSPAASAVSPAASAVSSAASAGPPATSAVTPDYSAATSTATPAVSAATLAVSAATPAPGASQAVCMLKCEHCDLLFHSTEDLMKHLKTDHKNLSLKNLEITYPDILHKNDCKLTKSVPDPHVRMKKFLHGPIREIDDWNWRMPMCVKES